MPSRILLIFEYINRKMSEMCHSPGCEYFVNMNMNNNNGLYCCKMCQSSGSRHGPMCGGELRDELGGAKPPNYYKASGSNDVAIWSSAQINSGLLNASTHHILYTSTSKGIVCSNISTLTAVYGSIHGDTIPHVSSIFVNLKKTYSFTVMGARKATEVWTQVKLVNGSSNPFYIATLGNTNFDPVQVLGSKTNHF